MIKLTVRRSPGNCKAAKTEMLWARDKIGRLTKCCYVQRTVEGAPAGVERADGEVRLEPTAARGAMGPRQGKARPRCHRFVHLRVIHLAD